MRTRLITKREMFRKRTMSGKDYGVGWFEDHDHNEEIYRKLPVVGTRIILK